MKLQHTIHLPSSVVTAVVGDGPVFLSGCCFFELACSFTGGLVAASVALSNTWCFLQGPRVCTQNRHHQLPTSFPYHTQLPTSFPYHTQLATSFPYHIQLATSYHTQSDNIQLIRSFVKYAVHCTHVANN